MIKNDKKTLESLSFSLDERDIANFTKTLIHLKSNKYSTISDKEIDKDLNTLKEITKLKLNQSFYAFHVEDSWAYHSSGVGSGISLYKRQGDELEDELTHSFGNEVPQLYKIIKYLQENNISKVYTGNIDGKFLGLEFSISDGNDNISIEKMNELEIGNFKLKNIEVVLLDKLL